MDSRRHQVPARGGERVTDRDNLRWELESVSGVADELWTAAEEAERALKNGDLGTIRELLSRLKAPADCIRFRVEAAERALTRAEAEGA